jgi:two-component system sensor histidine kinase CpxA
MRSFWAKIFFCMVLVPMLARGGGLLLNATLNEGGPPDRRALSAMLPELAGLAALALPATGPAAVQHALRNGGGAARLLPAPGPGCAVSGHAAQAIRVGDWCLVATPPPRPLLFGVVPAAWWFIMPVLELLLCGVLSAFLARYLARPIRRTRSAAMAFAAGDLSARAAPGGAGRDRRRDEAADLEREFDRMADRIAVMIAAQRRFIGDVSHEIRSPLGRLSMALGLARRDAGPALAPRFDRMEQEIDGISDLVRQLLALATLQASVDPPRHERVELHALLARVMDDVAFEFFERPRPFRLRRSEADVTVLGDPALLRRALENVLRNALFYTPEDAAVDVVVDRTGGAGSAGIARVLVRDHGPGVPETALPHLFEPFFRVDEARARNTGGAGLGLAISRRAVELHGGRIEARNTRPHGLAVRIELRATALEDSKGEGATLDPLGPPAPDPDKIIATFDG